MAKNFQQLWKEVTNSVDEVMSVRALADIVVDREGRAFVLGLDHSDAEYCIDILDRVSRDLLQPSSHSHMISSGDFRTPSQN